MLSRAAPAKLAQRRDDDAVALLECVGAVIAILCSVKNRILEPHAHTG